jgi:hypothetical protein
MSAWTRIEHKELTGTQATIEFTSIPSTYTDLVLVCSLRSNRNLTDDGVLLTFNNLTTNRTFRDLYGLGSGTPASSNSTVMRLASCPAATSTASTFGNTMLYIPNYAGNTNKSSSVDGVMENNATFSVQTIIANLWSSTAAISSIQIIAEIGSFVQYSSATLWGITKGSSGGVTVS